jgi:hypothetical protein
MLYFFATDLQRFKRIKFKMILYNYLYPPTNNYFSPDLNKIHEFILKKN